MEVEDKLEPFNPWKVEDIDQFLNYCCPECDTKQKTKSEFIVHAIDAHPKSRDYLPLYDFEEENENIETFNPTADEVFPDFEIKEDYVSSIEPEFSSTVKLEPLSIDRLLKMECDEEGCGRFFVTQESMLEHKRQCHSKSRRKVKKPRKLQLFILQNGKVVNGKRCKKCYKVTHPESYVTHRKTCTKGPLNIDEFFESSDDEEENISDEEENVFVKLENETLESEFVPNKKPKIEMSSNQKLEPTDDLLKCNEPDCEKLFVTLTNLLEHKEQNHYFAPFKFVIDPLEEKVKYKCDLCGIMFRRWWLAK